MSELTQEQQNENLERLLDLIADALIESPYVDSSIIRDNQKYIVDGQLKLGRTDGTLALFQKDVKANQEDLIKSTLNENNVNETLQQIANNINYDEFERIDVSQGDFIEVKIIGGGNAYNGLDITPLIFEQDSNPLNVSQFVALEQSASIVNVEQAEEFLDTNIYELLPTGDTRQARIIRFFNELNTLLPPIEPQFDVTGDGGVADGFVDRNITDGTWIGSEQYSQDNSISYAQDNPNLSNIEEEEAYFHRLKNTANNTNSTRTIEDIYNTIFPYLTDILEDSPIVIDDRPEYQNQSSGYLQFRNLNQGIIIRNTQEDFIESLNPNNPTWLTSDYQGLLSSNDKTNFIYDNPGTGFTITMWVKFLDKVSEGTLFNYGNPTRDENPFGFSLETYVLNKEDYQTEVNNIIEQEYALENLPTQYKKPFETSNTARFVKLTVSDSGVTPFDSHTATLYYPKGNNIARRLQTTFIPEDINEWYFICASFNPQVQEIFPDDAIYPQYKDEINYWLNHLNPFTGEFVGQSLYGNTCKVEIISRTELLRARGFKV